GRGSVGVPHRPGGGDERRPPRGHRRVPRHHRLRRRGAGDRDRGRRARPPPRRRLPRGRLLQGRALARRPLARRPLEGRALAERPCEGAGVRPWRDAGTGLAARRRPHRRAASGRRVPGCGADPPAGRGPMTIRVVLADDQPLVRAGLRVLVADTPDLEIVGEAGTGAEAVRLAEEVRPDVVLMDIRMPDMDGIEATRRITRRDGAARVLMLTTFDDDDYVYGSLRAGASGFLVKDMALEEILSAIRVVAGGDALIAPSVTRRLIEEFAARPEPAPPAGSVPSPAGSAPQAAGSGPRAAGSGPRALGAVTAREREVLTLVGRGMSNHEIAAELVISVATAKAHVARLLTKLDARDRVHLVIIAYETGLVRPATGGSTT